jgi:UDP-N-acetylmuramoylalanine--D-glutamate ligase
MDLKGKKVAVLGAGSSGLAAAALALSHGATVSAFDSGDTLRLSPAVERFAELGVVLTCGDDALFPSSDYDLSVISPGIDERWPIARAFSEASNELIGEVEFAFRLSETPVVAITGTNGKTTTTSLVAQMINGSGLKAVAAGNIGRAYSDVVASREELDWIVLEISSFQLETIKTFSPEVAVWMNFAADHLDRYKSLEDYKQAKVRLFKNGGKGKQAICKFEDNVGSDWLRTTFSAFSEGGDFGYKEGIIYEKKAGRSFDFRKTELQGKHNAENVMVSLAVADILGISWNDIEESIENFRAPQHRCEKVSEIDGVLYLNDSKSTNLHSLESAIAGQEAPLVLIVGGKQKGLDFSALAELVGERAKAAICIGEIKEEIARSWGRRITCQIAEDLNEAVDIAAEIAESGDIVLFSPGTSCFDMFSGYEERGDAFRMAVQSLSFS